MAYQTIDETVHTFDDTSSPKTKASDIETVEVEVDAAPKGKEREPADELEIVIEDDVPPADRKAGPAAPPAEEVSEDELKQYSARVQQRIKHLQRTMHDERRAKEQAAREKAELERLVQQFVNENSQLKGAVNKNQTALVDQAKRAAELRLAEAKRLYKDAYESGDAEKVVAAQTELMAATVHADKVNSVKVPSLQEQKPPVQQPQQPSVDPKAASWAERNRWFGQDDEMTSFALGYHNKLKKEGVDLQSNEYYEKIDTRMREMFPEKFGGSTRNTQTTQRQPKPNVVAPATRSTSAKKVVLTQTQVSLAKRLGLPLDVYAKHFAATMNGDQQ